MKLAARKEARSFAWRRPAEPSPRVVYTRAPVLLATIVAREEDRWRVRIGQEERVLGCADAVDPTLLDEACTSGASVVIDNSAMPPIVAGVISTRRAVTIDPDGVLKVAVKRFQLDAEEEALLRVPGAFLQITVREVEIYGARVMTRAREVAKILATMIKMN